MSQSAGDSTTGNIRGDVGHVAVGKDIDETIGAEAEIKERTELSQLPADLRTRATAEAPPDLRQAAMEPVSGLEEKEDLTAVVYMHGRFGEGLPSIAGLVVHMLGHSLVGKLVQDASDAAASRSRLLNEDDDGGYLIVAGPDSSLSQGRRNDMHGARRLGSDLGSVAQASGHQVVDDRQAGRSSRPPKRRKAA